MRRVLCAWCPAAPPGDGDVDVDLVEGAWPSRAVGSRTETGRSVWCPSCVRLVNNPSGVSIEWINWGLGGLFGVGWGVVSGKVEYWWCPSVRDFSE